MLYIEKYTQEEDKNFTKINLALKVMPQYNTERNALFMLPSSDVKNNL
jgi:hypothetical protein